MTDMRSYSYVYVVVDDDGDPTMVVGTEQEAIDLLTMLEPQWFDYFAVPYQHKD